MLTPCTIKQHHLLFPAATMATEETRTAKSAVRIALPCFLVFLANILRVM